MATHSSNSLEMPLLASAFSSALPHVICGQAAGRKSATQLVNNCHDARLMAMRATWLAQRSIIVYPTPGQMRHAYSLLDEGSRPRFKKHPSQ